MLYYLPGGDLPYNHPLSPTVVNGLAKEFLISSIQLYKPGLNGVEPHMSEQDINTVQLKIRPRIPRISINTPAGRGTLFSVPDEIGG